MRHWPRLRKHLSLPSSNGSTRGAFGWLTGSFEFMLYPFLTFEKHTRSTLTHSQLDAPKGASARLIVLFSPKLPVPRKSNEMSSVCTVCMGQIIWDMKRCSKYQIVDGWIIKRQLAWRCLLRQSHRINTWSDVSKKAQKTWPACVVYVVLYCFIRVNHVFWSSDLESNHTNMMDKANRLQRIQKLSPKNMWMIPSWLRDNLNFCLQHKKKKKNIYI